MSAVLLTNFLFHMLFLLHLYHLFCAPLFLPCSSQNSNFIPSQILAYSSARKDLLKLHYLAFHFYTLNLFLFLPIFYSLLLLYSVSNINCIRLLSIFLRLSLTLLSFPYLHRFFVFLFPLSFL